MNPKVPKPGIRGVGDRRMQAGTTQKAVRHYHAIGLLD